MQQSSKKLLRCMCLCQTRFVMRKLKHRIYICTPHTSARFFRYSSGHCISYCMTTSSNLKAVIFLISFCTFPLVTGSSTDIRIIYSCCFSSKRLLVYIQQGNMITQIIENALNPYLLCLNIHTFTMRKMMPIQMLHKRHERGLVYSVISAGSSCNCRRRWT